MTSRSLNIFPPPLTAGAIAHDRGEGILGNEYNRWSARVTPEHKATLPFTRLLAGPGDFTPGGFLNRQLDQFRFNVRPTQVQGTRCAELALFVCLESPICNAADHPSHYKDQPGLYFLKIVPTVWDDTRVLDGAVGEHLVIVRRHGSRWFLGALTDRNARDIPIKLDFLGRGSWVLKLWKDAPDSDTVGEHLVTEQHAVTAADVLTLHLARAGGAVACFEPVSPRSDLAARNLQFLTFHGPAIIKYLEGKGISWTVWCFDPEWGPTLIRNWNYELTPSGEFAKAAMNGDIK